MEFPVQKPLVAALAALVFIAPAAYAMDATLDSLAEGGHWKQVRERVGPRTGANSTDHEALYWMSRCLLAFGDKPGAQTFAVQAVALDGKNARYHYQLADVLGSMAQDAGPLKGLGLAGRFKKEAERAIALDPKLVGARRDLMEFYLVAPGIAGGDRKKANAQADTIAQIDPARGALAQADLAIKDKKMDQADAIYRKAIAAWPLDYEVLLDAAGFYGSDSQKKWGMVDTLGKTAVEVQPDRVGGYSTLAQLYAHQGRWDALDSLLAVAEHALPDNLNPTYQAGRVILTDGHEFERAERYFRKYLTQEAEGQSPTLAHAHWRLGLVLEKEGKKSDAVTEIETAVRLKPDLDAAKKDLNRLKKA